MKKFIFTLSLLPILLGAQVPAKIDFQAVARDAEGEVLSEQSITLRASVLPGLSSDTIDFQEEHVVTTDKFGLFAVAIGAGIPTQKEFTDIDWSAGPHYLQIEIDVIGGSNFINMGTLEMMSVPYAFYAKNAETAENVDDADADPQNEIQQLGLQGEVVSISGGNSIQLPDASPQNEIQQLNVQGEVMSISGGNSIQLPDGSAQNELQKLSFAEGGLLSISGGNTVQLPASTSSWKENGATTYLESPAKLGLGLKAAPHQLTLYGANQANLNFLTSNTEIGQSNGLLVSLNKLSHTAQIWNYERGEIRFGTDDKTRMIISPLGRIGIGTTAPSDRLEVGSSTGDVGMRINAANTRMAKLYLSETVASEKRGFNWAYDGSEKKLHLSSDAQGENEDSKLMSILSSGLVGIGTPTPKSELNVHSNRGLFSFLSTTHTDYPASILYVGLDHANPTIDFRDQPLIIKSENRLAIGIDPQQGFVGIGKDDPKVELDVDGDVEISDVLTVKEELVTRDMHVEDDALIEGSLSIGRGITFNQIEEFTGTTPEMGSSKEFSYPEGYTRSNTWVLSLQIVNGSGNRLGIGTGDSQRRINVVLLENRIRINYPPFDDYQNRTFRILLMRVNT